MNMNKKEIQYSKKYSICNPVIFSIVMENPDFCKGLLERIFVDRKVKDIRLKYAADADSIQEEAEHADTEYTGAEQAGTERVSTEQTVAVSVMSKSVRLDVLFEDDDTWYDIELQVRNFKDLPERSRYYQSIMTVDSLKPGEDYGELKRGYVIFICLFDPFALNKPVYSFEMYDRKNSLNLNDGQYTMFLNSKCTEDVPEELRTFYNYLQTGAVPEGDRLLEQMDEVVKEVGSRKGVREKVTLYDEMLRYQKSLERMKAEHARVKEEHERMEAENARVAAENARMEEENARVAAENARMEEENARVAAENARMEEENARVATENARMEEENARVAAENARIEAENARIKAEKAKTEEDADKARRRNQLTSALVKQGRLDDLVKAEEDEGYRVRLMEELGI